MRKLVTISIFVLMSVWLYAQVPQAINFQAIARDGNGDPMSSVVIQIRLSIVDSAQGGTIVYQELRALQTNAYGSFSFQIGVNPSFITVGSINAINWKTGDKHLKIDYDPTNTFSFNLSLGVIKFVTVPYAFTAETVVYIDATGAQNGDALIYNSVTGKFEPGQAGITSVAWNDITNKPTFSTVATTGSFNDLLNQPTIPTQYTDAMADIRVVAGITNKVDKVTGKGLSTNDYTTVEQTKLAGIATGAEVNVNADWNSTSGDAQIINKPIIATVATTGNYNDLTNKPVNSTNAIPRIGVRGTKLTVSFSGGDNVTFSQSSFTCPNVYSYPIFTQSSPSTYQINPTNIYFVDSTRFDAVFDIPDLAPTGDYNIIFAPTSTCPYYIPNCFRIY